MDTEAAVMANFDFLSSEGEVDDDDEVMGDDNDDGYSPEIKLKGSDVLDQVDKDTEEANDFNYVPGSGQAKDSNVDAVDGIKGDEHENLDDTEQAEQNSSSGDWGKNCLKKFVKHILELTFVHIDIEPSELERLKRLYKGENKKRQSLREGRES